MDIDALVKGFTTLGNDPKAATAYAAFVMACVAGQVGNGVWLWLGSEIECIADRFRRDAKSTARAVIAQLGGVIAFAAVIPFEDMPLRTAIILGILQGVAIDSKLNKSTRRVWDPETRAMVSAVRTTTENTTTDTISAAPAAPPTRREP